MATIRRIIKRIAVMPQPILRAFFVLELQHPMVQFLLRRIKGDLEGIYTMSVDDYSLKDQHVEIIPRWLCINRLLDGSIPYVQVF
uniref:Uncharacterized protein n=1 Tax=Solanum tuberosum TaxID=4113 RepID=M1BXI2_SOLTU